MQRSLLLHIVLFLGIFFGYFTTAHAQTALQISPFRFEITANPGDTKVDRIELRNNGDTPQTLTITLEDFHAGDEFGRPGFQTETTDALSLSRWITPETTTIQLPPRSTKEIPFAVRIPANAEPGGHYATMFFSPEVSEQGNVAVQGRIGALVLLQVAGEVVEQANIDQFGLFHPEVDFAQQQHIGSTWLYEDLPVSFALRLQNTGNVHVRPQGSIALYDMWGNQLQNIGIERTVNQEGVFLSQKQANTLSVNPEYGVVLPNSYRTFRGIQWDGYLYEKSNPSTGKVELIKEKPWMTFGKFRAELTLELGKETITRTVEFWIIPWKLLLITFTSAVLTFFLLRFALRKYHHYTMERLRATITS